MNSVVQNFVNYYRPHPKDGGRYCFQFVGPHLDRGGRGTRSSLGWGGTPSPGGTPTLDGGGYPVSGLGGYPISGWGGGGYPVSGLGGYPSQVGGYNISGLGGCTLGTSPSKGKHF